MPSWHIVKNRVQAKITNIGTISDTIIGDNIEDFESVTQEHANVDALLPKVGKSLFILPNPMYGSW